MKKDLRMIFLIQLRIMWGLTQTPDAITEASNEFTVIVTYMQEKSKQHSTSLSLGNG